MPRLYLILLFIIYNEEASAQIVRSRIDVFNTGAYHERFTEALAASTHPAALAFCRSFTAGMYGGRRFMMQEVQHFILAAALPVADDGMGVLVDHFTTPAYRRSTMALGYAKKLGWATIGTRFHYNHIVVPGYVRVGNLDVEAGTNLALNDQLRLAMLVYLPAGNKWRSAYRYRMGLGYMVSDQLLMVVEAGRDEDKPVSIHAGICYSPTPRWIIQLGISIAGTQPYICSSFQWSNLRILVAVIYSMQLGSSPGLALVIPPKTVTP